MAAVALQLWEDPPAAGLVPVRPVQVPLDLLEARARGYERGSKAANTWRAYASDLRQFSGWCDRRGLCPLPAAPDTVRLYLVDAAGWLAVSTLRRRLAAISEAHAAAQLPNPTSSPAVRFAWEGIRRAHGAPPRAKEAAVTEVVATLVGPLGGSLIDVRDRAVLLLGFAAALRRSELSGLDVDDVTATAEGLRITVRRSKTDQPGAGATVGIVPGSNPATCPVSAWQAWQVAAGIATGPAFRRLRRDRAAGQRLAGDGIARMVKRRAQLAGLDPSLFSGHSLRSGFATTAARAGVAEHQIMRQGRWTSSAAMRAYIRDGDLFAGNPSAQLGL